MTPKYLRIYSDVHLDFDVQYAHRREHLTDQFKDLTHVWFPEPMNEDLETILVLPGDLWHSRKFLSRRWENGKSWLGQLAERFHSVVFILGNHDYWDGNLSLEPQKVREELKAQALSNVHFLEDEVAIIGNVKFIGGTLWTSFDDASPLVMMNAPNIMQPDYKLIRHGPGYVKVRPAHFYSVHRQTRSFILANAHRDSPEQRVVVVTHMAPSFQSVHEKYRSNQFDMMANHYYYSALENDIFHPDFVADLWCHGHMHAHADYVIDRTRVLCNPRGYRMASGNVEGMNFNPTLRIDIDGLGQQQQY